MGEKLIAALFQKSFLLLRSFQSRSTKLSLMQIRKGNERAERVCLGASHVDRATRYAVLSALADRGVGEKVLQTIESILGGEVRGACPVCGNPVDLGDVKLTKKKAAKELGVSLPTFRKYESQADFTPSAFREGDRDYYYLSQILEYKNRASRLKG